MRFLMVVLLLILPSTSYGGELILDFGLGVQDQKKNERIVSVGDLTYSFKSRHPAVNTARNPLVILNIKYVKDRSSVGILHISSLIDADNYSGLNILYVAREFKLK